jgi:hypothetical protein
MLRISRRNLTLTFLLFLAGLTAGNASAPKQTSAVRKNASGCTRMDGAPSNFGCVDGSGGCYECEYTDRYGTFRCWEFPNPADGTYCSPIAEFQGL